MNAVSVFNKGIGLGAVVALSVTIQIASGGPASADAFADCVRDAASQDLAAKTAFQRDLRDLIVEQRGEFAAVATVNRDLQIAFAEARRARFDYLLAHDPDRIDTANGLSRFSNFDWSEADSNNFMAESESYRDLEQRIARLEERNNGHPDWPKLREYFHAELTRSPAFSSVMAHFQGRQIAVAARLAECRRS